MIVTKENLIQILDNMGIEEMDISIEIETKTNTSNKEFYTDHINGYKNSKIIDNSIDKVNIFIKSETNVKCDFVGFER